MAPKFLLIGHPDETLWFHNLTNALKALGDIQVLPLTEAMHHIRQNKYDIVIIDKSFVKEEIHLVVNILSRQPATRIIAITSTPTWQQIRDILKAGGMDYISKSMNEREYLSILRDVLEKHPST